MAYGRSTLEDLRLAEEAGVVFPVAEVEVASEDEEGDGLEGLTVPELRATGEGASAWGGAGGHRS
jgi:hypothetical protein